MLLPKTLDAREKQAADDLKKLRQRYKQRYAEATAALRAENESLATHIQNLRDQLAHEQVRN